MTQDQTADVDDLTEIAEDKLGKLAMRIIATAIVCCVILVLIDQGVDGFPYGVYGLIGACVLAVIAFLVGQVS